MPTSAPPLRLTRSALVVALVYLAIGSLYIWASDRLVALVADDDALLSLRWQTLKGLAFVLVTAVATFLLLWRRGVVMWRASESRRAEESERLALFENGPEGGFVLEDSRFVLANQATGSLFRCDPRELIGRAPWEVSPPEQPDGSPSEATARQRLGEATADRTFRFHWRHRRFDGSDFDCEVSLSVVPGPARRILAWVRDVTEERQAKEQLTAANERLRILVEGTPAFFFYVQDLDGTVTYVSPSVELITGRSVSEWLAQRHWFTTDNPLNEEARRATHRHLAGVFDGEPTIVEIARPDGQPVVLEAYEFGYFRDGVFAGLQGIAQDITARRRAEEALRESERILATLMANLPGMAYRCRNDRDWTMEFVSEGCRELTGYAPAELILNGSVSYAELIHPDDVEAVWRNVQAALSERRPFQLNYRLRTAAGEEKWVWEKGRGVFDEQGRLRWLEGFINDVTERRLVEEKARFQASLLDQVRNAVVAADRQGRITYWNSSATELLGWRADEVLGKRLIDVVGPLRRAGLRRKVVAGLLRSGHWEGETELLRRDGRAVVLDVVGAATRGEDGAVSGFVAVASDITARRRAERVRNAAFRVAQDAVSTRTLDDFFPAVHAVVASLLPAENFYVALHDPLAKTLRFPYFVDQMDEPPDPQPVGHGLTELVLRNGESVLASPVVFEELVARGEIEPLGSPSIDWLGVPLRVKDALIGVLAVQTYTEGVRYSEEDKAILEFVSTQVALAIEHVRAEQALRESEERFRRLVEMSPDGIAVHCDGKVVFMNEQGVRVLGYRSVDEVLGRPATDFIHPDSLTIVAERMRRVVSATAPMPPLEESFMRADGSRVEMEVAATPFVFQGKPAGQVVFRDVSERKEMEARLLQSQKQEAIGRLAGGIAHDFNNLLQAMLSTLQICRVRGGDDVGCHQVMLELESQIRRGASLSRQLLLFSRREVGRPEVLDLSEIIRSACDLVRRLLPEHIHMSVWPAGEALPILADGGQIEQVIVNLVVNAADAMPGGGKLEVTTGRQDSEVWLQVSDTGVGMAAAVRERIFEPFFTTKGSDERSGVGLAVVHGIVERHGGRIEVASAPGNGSVFRILFPRSTRVAEPQAARPPSPPAASLPGRGESVLLVEDEGATREGLRDALSMLGYKVTAVADGESALREAGKGSFAVLLTDLILPGMHGGELARRLVAQAPDLAVVVMSGYTEDEAVKRGAREGRLRFLQKPFDIDTLAKELRRVLDSD